MLHVLPATFELVLQRIRLHGFFSWVVKRATSLFSSFGSNVAKQVARFLAARSTVALAPDACITIKIRLNGFVC